MNRQRNRAVAVTTALISVFLLSTCQQFFTTSLAEVLARDSYTIPADISVADAVSLLDAAIAEGDATMAAALVPGLYAAAGAASAGSAEYNEAANALASAVVMSSGVGPVVATVATLFLSADPDADPELFIAEAIASVSTVALNDAEMDALLMIADNPPEGLSADDAYTAAFALVADAFVDAEVNLADLAEFDLDAPPAGVNQDSIDAALELLSYADGLPVDEGSSNIFADIFSSMGLSAP